MDLLEDDAPSPNAPEFTVSEISGAVKKTLEQAFGRIRVRGEIGRVMKAGSGHLYYDLKDDRNVISCNTWKGQVAGLSVLPEEGLEVIVTGKVSSFGGQSRYNLNVDSIEVAGEGALMALLEKRKKAMAAEGLFDADRKKPLPYLPEIIGVVTSPQGAVIRDILHRLRDRFPRKVLIWPVAVQGKACAPQVTAAIQGFNAMAPGGPLPRPDLIIVARGGGSIEDLWGFNEETVARAAAASDIPLISAVGHETDTTLIDYVSDMRAPTPTAAAEMAVPVRLDLLASVDSYGARMAQTLSRTVAQRKQRVDDLGRALGRMDGLTSNPRQRLDMVGGRLETALSGGVATKRLRFEKAAQPLRPTILDRQAERIKTQINQASRHLDTALERCAEKARARFERNADRLTPKGLIRDLTLQRDRLTRAARATSKAGMTQVSTWRTSLDRLDRLRETLSYHATLERGYAVVWDGDKVITNSKSAKKASQLEVQFKDARIPLGAAAKVSKPKTPKPGQPSLFDD